jgi:phthalate 4,5-cis-dihydrodiol dehydrogenase
MITALNYTDFLYRPRRPEELATANGGGVVFSQAAHQVDIVRLLGGGRIKTVRAATGSWDPARATEGAYGALLMFEDGAFASIAYSGHGYFDSDEFCGWTGELGQRKNAQRYGSARKALQRLGGPEEEAAFKSTRGYGGANEPTPASAAGLHEHFGLVLVSCARADLRPLPTGVMIYDDFTRRLDPLPPPIVPRAAVIDELYGAVACGRQPMHSGEWGLATLEVCLALLRSSREQSEITLQHQVRAGERHSS